MERNTTPPGNLVVVWNNIYLDVVRHIGGAPGPLARIGALMHLAMYEAANRLTPSTPYPTLIDDSLLSLPTTGTSDPATSAAYAACYALTAATEAYMTTVKQMQGGILNPFDPFQVHPAADPHSLGLVVNTGDNAAVDSAGSEAYGKAIAEAVLKAYPADTGLATTVEPVLSSLPGEWRDTGSGPALTPRWGQVPLFLVRTLTTDYLPTVFDGFTEYADLLRSPVYAAQVGETKLLGEAHSAARTPEQTEIAFFWANDLNGTSKPPGQWYTIVQSVARQQGTLQDLGEAIGAHSGLLQTTRLFALVGTAMVNASIVAWQAKYFWPTSEKPLRLWRPETAIQLADTDGNPSTIADPAWQPLSAMVNGVRFSPNFPAFVSGHSTFGAAWAAAMKAFFGTNAIAFTAATEDTHGVRDENGIRRTRTFTSFTQAALENSRSRIYLGVHYQFDANGGFEIGTKVGEDTAKEFAERSEKAGVADDEMQQGKKRKKGKQQSLAAVKIRGAALENFVEPQADAEGAGVDTIQNVTLLKDAGDVFVIFSLNTYGSWQSSMAPTVALSQPLIGGGERVEKFGTYAEAIAAKAGVWVLTINNISTSPTPYTGGLTYKDATTGADKEKIAVLLIQAKSREDAIAGKGTVAHDFPLDGTIKVGENFISRGVLSFY